MHGSASLDDPNLTYSFIPRIALKFLTDRSKQKIAFHSWMMLPHVYIIQADVLSVETHH